MTDSVSEGRGSENPGLRLFYASAGAADLIASHRYWRSGADNPNEMSLTFSGQVESVVAELGGQAYLLSRHSSGEIVRDDDFVIEHRPAASASGWRYFWREASFCWGMVRTARSFGANVAVIDTGATELFLASLFRLRGMRVVVVMHNTLWADGYRPTRGVRAAINGLNRLFFRYCCSGIIAVSPAVERQIRQLVPGLRSPVLQTRAQFRAEAFAAIPPPPPQDVRPFHILFSGRVEEAKGVFDIARMAYRIEQTHPGVMRWTICGRGDDLDTLRAMIGDLGIGHIVDARGWTAPADLRTLYGSAHATIVPTRSGFPEGLAMTAVEAALAGRPVITNPAVPAHELLAGACIVAKTDDVASHAEAALALATDATLYNRLCSNTTARAAPFLDHSQGLTAVMKRMVTSNRHLTNR